MMGNSLDGKPNPVFLNPPSRLIPPPQSIPASIDQSKSTTTIKPLMGSPPNPITSKPTTVKPPMSQQSVPVASTSSKHHETKSEKLEDQILQSLLNKASFNVPKPGSDIG